MPRSRKAPDGIFWLTLEDTERKLIQSAMKAHGNSVHKAAKMLGISDRYLYRRLDYFGLRDVVPRDADPDPPKVTPSPGAPR